MSSRLNRTALVLVLFVVVFLTSSCGGQGNNYKRVQLKAEGQASSSDTSVPTNAPLRIGIAAVISPKETFRSYNEILDYFSTKLDRPVELVQRTTYSEMNDLVRSGNVDLAFVCTQAYVEGQIEFGMEALVVPQVRGETLYYSYLIVPKDGDTETFEQLRARTFAFTDPMSNSGRLAAAFLLAKMGESPDSFFKKYVYSYSHDNSIKAVAQRLVDGASVDSLVFEHHEKYNPEHTSKTRIIEKLGPFGIPPVVVNPGLDPNSKEQLRSVFLGMDDDLNGREILKGLLIDKFVVPDDRQYDLVREMISVVRKK